MYKWVLKSSEFKLSTADLYTVLQIRLATEDDNAEPASFAKRRACKRRVLRPMARGAGGRGGEGRVERGKPRMEETRCTPRRMASEWQRWYRCYARAYVLAQANKSQRRRGNVWRPLLLGARLITRNADRGRPFFSRIFISVSHPCGSAAVFPSPVACDAIGARCARRQRRTDRGDTRFGVTSRTLRDDDYRF